MSTLPIQKSVIDNAEELKSYMADLNSWLKDIKEIDNNLLPKSKGVTSQESMPPIRKPLSTPCSSSYNANEHKKVKLVAKETKKERISSYNYVAWDKFDVDKALKSGSSSEEEEEERDVKSQDNESQLKRLMTNEPKKEFQSESINQNNLDKAEKYKEEGNKLYSKGKYSDAIAKYTQGMALSPSNPLLPANRAMAYIKLKKYKAAENDCNRALDLDHKYVKSFMRRATARTHLDDFNGAVNDYKKVLALEPFNKEAKKELEIIKAKLNSIQLAKQSGHNKEQTAQAKVVEIEKEELGEVKIPESYSRKKTNERSLKPLVNIPIVEVENECDIDRIQNEKMVKTQKLSTSENIKQSSAPEPDCQKQDVKVAQPSLPKIPKNSHQFSQGWNKIQNFQELKLLYLKSIPATFFGSTEFDVDLIVEIIDCLCDQSVEVNEASNILNSLVKSRGFYINLSFLDSQQKKVFENILRKIESLPQNEHIEHLKKALYEPM